MPCCFERFWNICSACWPFWTKYCCAWWVLAVLRFVLFFCLKLSLSFEWCWLKFVMLCWLEKYWLELAIMRSVSSLFLSLSPTCDCIWPKFWIACWFEFCSKSWRPCWFELPYCAWFELDGFRFGSNLFLRLSSLPLEYSWLIFVILCWFDKLTFFSIFCLSLSFSHECPWPKFCMPCCFEMSLESWNMFWPLLTE